MSAQKESTLTGVNDIEIPVARENKVLFSWKAPERIFKRRNKEFWTTVLSMVFLLSLICIFIQQWMLILVMASLVFLSYVYSTVPPAEIEFKITLRGVQYAEQEIFWDQLSCFWFSQRNGVPILNFGMKLGLQKIIYVIYKKDDEKEIKNLLLRFLSEEALPPTFVDKAASWLSQKIPLEIS